MYNEAFVSSTGRTQDRDLGADAVWLAGVVATQPPGAGRGLGAGRAAHHPARPGRRPVQPDGRAGAAPRPGPQPAGTAARSQQGERLAGARRLAPLAPAATSSRPRSPRVTPTRPSWEETDWLQIVTLYGVLLEQDPSPVVRLNRAVALAQLGPRQAAHALAEVEALADRLRRLPPVPRDPRRAAPAARPRPRRPPRPTARP